MITTIKLTWWPFYSSWSLDSRTPWTPKTPKTPNLRVLGVLGVQGVQSPGILGSLGVRESYQLLGYPLPDVYSNKVKEQLTYFMRKKLTSLLLFHTPKKQSENNI